MYFATQEVIEESEADQIECSGYKSWLYLEARMKSEELEMLTVDCRDLFGKVQRDAEYKIYLWIFLQDRQQ